MMRSHAAPAARFTWRVRFREASAACAPLGGPRDLSVTESTLMPLERNDARVAVLHCNWLISARRCERISSRNPSPWYRGVNP